mmetsp:Transcript_26811/g.57480  ORF Transcript_26811/g.57480 Transcript_26811/m.57480 type:complete len:106 (+) Transcript_26811:207-524(+)
MRCEERNPYHEQNNNTRVGGRHGSDSPSRSIRPAYHLNQIHTNNEADTFGGVDGPSSYDCVGVPSETPCSATNLRCLGAYRLSQVCNAYAQLHPDTGIRALFVSC